MPLEMDLMVPLFQKGGSVMRGVAQAGKKAAEAQKTQQTQQLKKGKKLVEVLKSLKEEGDIGAIRRLERIGDEAPYAAERIDERALRSALSGGDNAATLAIIKPQDFRYLAAPLPSDYLSYERTPTLGAMELGGTITPPEYLRHLSDISQNQGFRDIPFLQYGEQKGTSRLGVKGHEGRHRMRALEDMGDEGALVRLLPQASVREPLPRMSRSEFLEALAEKYGTPLRLDPEDFESVITDLSKPVTPFQKGGSALKGAIAAGKAAKEAKKDKPPKVKQTVKEPVRVAFPGIYKRPDVIAAEAAAQVAPESPALKQLFGVTRQDLADIARSRKGNLPGTLPGAAANPRGSEAATKVMTRANEQRILDAMAEAEKYPELVTGMDPWYVMDPLYQLMVKELGPEQAMKEYPMMNALMGMASPGSEVTTEIPRGSAAYYLQKQGRFPEFEEFLGMPFSQRGPEVAEDIRTVPGHMYHSTAQAVPMRRFLESGEMEMTTPKVPLYIQASGVPEVGFQTRTPVGDAHWSRATGLADVRGAKQFAGSVSNPEMTQLAPWWRSKIAEQLGIEPVSAQARAWGTFAPQTGVTTPIGSPKLELLADQAVLAGRRMGVPPEDALKMFILGEGRLGKKEGGAVQKGALAVLS